MLFPNLGRFASEVSCKHAVYEYLPPFNVKTFLSSLPKKLSPPGSEHVAIVEAFFQFYLPPR